jgi:CRAL/TRIO domain
MCRHHEEDPNAVVLSTTSMMVGQYYYVIGTKESSSNNDNSIKNDSTDHGSITETNTATSALCLQQPHEQGIQSRPSLSSIRRGKRLFSRLSSSSLLSPQQQQQQQHRHHQQPQSDPNTRKIKKENKTKKRLLFRNLSARHATKDECVVLEDGDHHRLIVSSSSSSSSSSLIGSKITKRTKTSTKTSIASESSPSVIMTKPRSFLLRSFSLSSSDRVGRNDARSPRRNSNINNINRRHHSMKNLHTSTTTGGENRSIFNKEQQQEQLQQQQVVETAAVLFDHASRQISEITSLSSSSSTCGSDQDSIQSSNIVVDIDILIDNDDHEREQQDQPHVAKPDLYGQIHVHETKELLETSMKEFEIELKKQLSCNKNIELKDYVLLSEQCCCNIKDENVQNTNNKVVNVYRIKSIFLRSCSYQINDAVERYMNYWNKRVLLFGMERAFQPLTVSSLTKSELRILRSGTLGVVKKEHLSKEKYDKLLQHQQPQRHGTTTSTSTLKYHETRDIVIMDYSKFDKSYMQSLDYTRCLWYIAHIMLIDPLSNQRGLIFFTITKNCSMKQMPSMEFMKLHLSYVGNSLPTRVSALHTVYLPTIAKIVMPIVNRLLGDILRQRILFHIDVKNNEQLVKKLYDQYGISSTMLPNYLGGDYEWNEQKWIQKQTYIESTNGVDI